MSKETILIVDDEKDILELLEYNLRKEGYVTVPCQSGEEAVKTAVKIKPDLIALDLMLPGIDGIEVCRMLKIKEETRQIPIIMITAKGDDSDQIIGLEIGADDYVTKPFSPKVLIARIRSLIRRGKSEQNVKQNSVIRIHNIQIDPIKHEVISDGDVLDLSVTEFSILELLAASPGWVFSRNQIICSVKGDDYPVTERSVDVQILGLRKKLGSYGNYIETIRGVGYRMREK